MYCMKLPSVLGPSEVFYLWLFHFVVLFLFAVFLVEFVRNYGKQIKLELFLPEAEKSADKGNRNCKKPRQRENVAGRGWRN